MSEEKPLSAWSAVPEIGYDVLARMMPGAMAIGIAIGSYACFRYWLRPPALDWDSIARGISAWVLLALIVACWVLGLLLTPIGGMFWSAGNSRKYLVEVMAQYGSVLRKAEGQGIITMPQGITDWYAAPGDLYQQLHEHLKDRKPEWRSILTKNQGDVMFYANVAGASIMGILIDLVVAASLWLFRPNAEQTLLSRHLLAFCITSVVPLLSCLGVSLIGFYSKHRRLWVRHIALLAVDMRPPERDTPEVASFRVRL